MKIFSGVVLILFALLWLFGISALYGDSFMSYNHAILYSMVCFLLIAIGAFLIYSHVQNKKR